MLPHYLVKGNGQAPGTRSTRDNLLFSLQLRQMFASFFNVRHTHSFNGPLYGTNHVSRYQRGKQIWILLKQETVSGSGNSWAWAIMQICTSLQTDNHASTPPLSFYRPSCRAANNVKAVKAFGVGLSTFVRVSIYIVNLFILASTVCQTEHSVCNNVVGRLKFRHTQARAELVWEPPPRPDLAEGETRRGYLQWLKCLGTQGNGVPSPLIIGK